MHNLSRTGSSLTIRYGQLSSESASALARQHIRQIHALNERIRSGQLTPADYADVYAGLHDQLVYGSLFGLGSLFAKLKLPAFKLPSIHLPGLSLAPLSKAAAALGANVSKAAQAYSRNLGAAGKSYTRAVQGAAAGITKNLSAASRSFSRASAANLRSFSRASAANLRGISNLGKSAGNALQSVLQSVDPSSLLGGADQSAAPSYAEDPNAALTAQQQYLEGGYAQAASPIIDPSTGLPYAEGGPSAMNLIQNPDGSYTDPNTGETFYLDESSGQYVRYGALNLGSLLSVAAPLAGTLIGGPIGGVVGNLLPGLLGSIGSKAPAAAAQALRPALPAAPRSFQIPYNPFMQPTVPSIPLSPRPQPVSPGAVQTPPAGYVAVRAGEGPYQVSMRALNSPDWRALMRLNGLSDSIENPPMLRVGQLLKLPSTAPALTPQPTPTLFDTIITPTPPAPRPSGILDALNLTQIMSYGKWILLALVGLWLYRKFVAPTKTSSGSRRRRRK